MKPFKNFIMGFLFLFTVGLGIAMLACVPNPHINKTDSVTEYRVDIRAVAHSDSIDVSIVSTLNPSLVYDETILPNDDSTVSEYVNRKMNPYYYDMHVDKKDWKVSYIQIKDDDGIIYSTYRSEDIPIVKLDSMLNEYANRRWNSLREAQDFIESTAKAHKVRSF